jgi:hypothetical protein
MKRVTAMIPAIEATAARLLDGVVGQAEFDLVAALAFPSFRGPQILLVRPH